MGNYIQSYLHMQHKSEKIEIDRTYMYNGRSEDPKEGTQKTFLWRKDGWQTRHCQEGCKEYTGSQKQENQDEM